MRSLSAAVAVLLCSLSARAEDGGTPFTLFDDYHCVDAPPMQQVDGGWLATDARKARIDCALLGANGELHDWRPSSKPPAQTPTVQPFQLLPSHGVLAVLSAAVTSYLAIVTSRAQRNCRGTFNPFGGC
jgi:hypothetical protein